MLAVEENVRSTFVFIFIYLFICLFDRDNAQFISSARVNYKLIYICSPWPGDGG